MTNLSRAAASLTLLLLHACAANTGPRDGGAGMDGGRPDGGPVVTPDATVPPDAGSEEDGGPLITDGMTCSVCEVDDDCNAGFYCANLGSGDRACLPACNIDLPDCPPRFNCVMSFNETTLPEPVCAPVGERCCVDADGDLHGAGVGCLGIDCDESDPAIHDDATETCSGSDEDCDGTIDEGDPDVLCPRGPHVAESACSDLGVCENRTCEVGYGDCDDDRANGCETRTNTEVHCGGCFMACDPANATGDCSTGTCDVAVCDAGFGDCNGDPADGCETPLNTLTNCGACGNGCSPAFGIGDCSSGTCQVGSCDPRRADCDGSPINGCETSTTTNADCGACGTPCAPANAIGECSTGACRVVSCTRSDYADCDGVASNGCERSLRTNTDCAACDVACTLPGASASCASGTCVPTGCAMGLADCTSAPGCETPTNTNTNCGDCNTPCAPANATGSCSTGTCRVVSCNVGWGNCDGDHANGCDTPLNTLSDCGSCGTTCALANASETCSTRACRIDACEFGYGQCDTNQANGCETSLRTNSNCGSCGTTCSRPFSTTSCSSGTCAWTGCQSGHSTCDGSTANGCEVDHDTTYGSCGSTIGDSNVGTYDGDRYCNWPGCGSNTTWDQFASRTDRRDRWYRGRVREDSTCSATIEHRIRLSVPAGVDYDLRVYRGSTCGTLAGSSNTRALGADETVIVSQSDASGPDDDFDYFVHVVWVSGASCSNYTIYFDGHDC